MGSNQIMLCYIQVRKPSHLVTGKTFANTTKEELQTMYYKPRCFTDLSEPSARNTSSSNCNKRSLLFCNRNNSLLDLNLDFCLHCIQKEDKGLLAEWVRHSYSLPAGNYKHLLRSQQQYLCLVHKMLFHHPTLHDYQLYTALYNCCIFLRLVGFNFCIRKWLKMFHIYKNLHIHL